MSTINVLISASPLSWSSFFACVEAQTHIHTHIDVEIITVHHTHIYIPINQSYLVHLFNLLQLFRFALGQYHVQARTMMIHLSEKGRIIAKELEPIPVGGRCCHRCWYLLLDEVETHDVQCWNLGGVGRTDGIKECGTATISLSGVV